MPYVADKAIKTKTENVTPGFKNVKQAIDLDKCEFGEMLVRVHSGEKRLGAGGVGDSRQYQLIEDWSILCQALRQEIKICGEPDGLSAFEQPAGQWKRGMCK